MSMLRRNWSLHEPPENIDLFSTCSPVQRFFTHYLSFTVSVCSDTIFTAGCITKVIMNTVLSILMYGLCTVHSNFSFSVLKKLNHDTFSTIKVVFQFGKLAISFIHRNIYNFNFYVVEDMSLAESLSDLSDTTSEMWRQKSRKKC